MTTATLTRTERIGNLENYLIENKLGSDSLAFTEMMVTTNHLLGCEDTRQYNAIKCHSLEDTLAEATLLIKQGYVIAEAVREASGQNSQDFYARLNVGQMAKLQKERLIFKSNKNK